MQFFLRRRAGMTVVELLVALALTGFVMVPAGTLLVQSFRNEAAYRQQNSTQQNARHAVDLLADDMKGAARAMTVVTSGTVQASMPTDTVRGVGAGTPSYTAPLYFTIYDDSEVKRRVRYWLEGTNLRREVVTFVDETVTPGPTSSATNGMVVARNVSAFSAQKPLLTPNDLTAAHYNTVRISLTCTEATGNQQSSTSVQADITLRNNLL